MPYNTIRDPGISRGFSILADAFTPNAGALVQADLAAKRRDQLLAETEGQTLENKQRQNQITSTRQLQEILAGNPNMSDPALRGRIMSNLAAMEGGLQYGPGFAAGSATFVNPNFVNESDLSKILLGTGVTSTFAGTPDGQARDLSNALELQRMKDNAAFDRQILDNAGAMDRTRYETDNGGTNEGRRATVSPETSDKLFEDLQSRLIGEQGQYSGAVIEPELAAAMRLELAQRYAQSKNAEQAIADVLAGVPVERYTYDTWAPFDEEDRLRLAKPNAPAAASPSPSAPAASGPTATDPKTGKKIRWDGTAWVPVK